MSRILCLDVGEKKIGIAVSDEKGITAQGIETFVRKSLKKDVEHIRERVSEFSAGEIVVGLPLNMNGEMGVQARKVSRFIQHLERELSIQVIVQDERLTTVQASRVLINADVSRKKRKKVIDMLAAQLILQGYLDYKRTNTPLSTQREIFET